MCVDERCPHLYYYDDLLLLRLRLTTTPYSFSSPKHSPLLHTSRPLFLNPKNFQIFSLWKTSHSFVTHTLRRTASLRFGPKMKRTAASNGVASPPSVVVAAEKPKRKKRRSAYDRTEREGDDETKKVVQKQPPKKPLARFGSRALKVITNAFKTTFGKKASKIQRSDKESEKAFRFGRKRIVLDGFIVLDGVWRNFQK